MTTIIFHIRQDSELRLASEILDNFRKEDEDSHPNHPASAIEIAHCSGAVVWSELTFTTNNKQKWIDFKNNWNCKSENLLGLVQMDVEE